jgi:hypothetical protein
LPAATVVMHLPWRACCRVRISATALLHHPLTTTHSRHVYPQGRPPSEPGCTYKSVRAVRVLHSLGSGPFRLRLERSLQVGRTRALGGGMHALHNTAPADAQAVPTPQLCSTMAALCMHGTIPLPARSGVMVRPSSTHMHASCSACHAANLFPTTKERPGYIQSCCQIWAACSKTRPRD